MTNELFLKIIETTFPESKISDYAQKLVTLTEAAKKLAEWAIEDPKAPVKDIFVAIEDLERV